ncbi:orotate phosphoribosyltransferase [Mycoplasma todarodis]|uniref:Orotate phosphoribosyltransferase n=1 Tax=Mycoplasma todarodis TaxID=1937191 RepID=A0A4R0XUB9_9MOLU|nr:orotate phosphoribosyltransferase [Mycoplasma todarodis]TCG11387.1 orotate phosphoribosyltransferase [Mycoplasma todarodis]
MNKIAKHLLDIKAVQLNTKERFTWASGIKSPIYTDNRLIMSYPEARKEIEAEFAKLIKKTFPEVTLLMGTATAGIPHAAFLSEIMEMPMGYVRGSAKAHGKQNQIEGLVRTGDKIVVIEDLFSTGGSSLSAIKSLEDQGYEVLGVVSIFSYELSKLKTNFKNVKHASLVTLEELLIEAKNSSYLEESEIKEVQEFISEL